MWYTIIHVIFSLCPLVVRSRSLHRLWILQLQLPGLWHRQPLQWICRFVEPQCDFYFGVNVHRVSYSIAHYPTMCPCAVSGMAELDYGLYPSREMQMDWLRVYLQAYKLFTKKTEEVSPRELETLYVQVNKFALVRRNMFAHTHTHTPATQSHTLTHIVSYYFNLISNLFLLRLLTSFGVSGHSSRPNTPPSTLTSSGKLLCECVKGSEQCVVTPWVRIT